MRRAAIAAGVWLSAAKPERASDRYGTYASAQYTASQIAGARFMGFDQGGHTWVGHDDEVMGGIRSLVMQASKP